MHRLERTTDGADRHKKIVCDFEQLNELLVDLYLEAESKPPQRVVLDLDVTDTPFDSEQQGRFFHGYYGHYCYLLLYIFARRASVVRAAAGGEPGRCDG